MNHGHPFLLETDLRHWVMVLYHVILEHGCTGRSIMESADERSHAVDAPCINTQRSPVFSLPIVNGPVWLSMQEKGRLTASVR